VTLRQHLMGTVGLDPATLVNLGNALVAIRAFAWEVTRAIWLLAKGFNASACAVASPNTATHELLSAASTPS
jgi:hypothetical protein